MKVRFLGRSATQAREVDAWWRENRDAAPSLFADELTDALRLLKKIPLIGAPYAPMAKDGIRRLLLRRTQYYVYYVVDADAKILGVLAIWSCLRGRPPALTRGPRGKTGQR